MHMVRMHGKLFDNVTAAFMMMRSTYHALRYKGVGLLSYSYSRIPLDWKPVWKTAAMKVFRRRWGIV